MKINRPSNITPGQLYQSQQKQAKESKAAKGTQGDKIEISTEAKRIKELVRKTISLPDIRNNVVDGLKQKIDKGEYKVSSEDIVKGMLENI
ncbi:flagellar biosynthesis anti-sigma factor FlgM [Desulfitibacter alkalitolerans]|uniref:flagellar biosynthesis anti-sigma factor FlgM n=1 Tax=Desulfitibacter alkalitolerans TaxID=264641 RepID=UPI0004800757|nr:flagellar biosynthesis anti-sigma factor FlgM [Desulfitibacter alkalitolerans]